MTSTQSFGVHLAGLPVRLPAGTPLEFVAQAPLYPLPLAPGRVAGLMQLRGQPVLVLDASPGAPMRRAAEVHDVLVVGALPEAAALIVDGPPQPIAEGGAPGPLPAEEAGVRDACPFADALVGHRAAAGESERGWYDVDPARLFDALVRP